VGEFDVGVFRGERPTDPGVMEIAVFFLRTFDDRVVAPSSPASDTPAISKIRGFNRRPAALFPF
jgi:hypothetical protein